MNAVGIYVQTAQLLLRTEPNSSNSIEQFNDLNRLLGHLRQLLACAVCSRLLNDPFSPRERNCQHNVCRLCIRGRKCLRPPCTDCKDCQDFKTYVENPQMRCLLLCFKSLCEHVMGAQPLYQQLCRQKQTLPAVVSSQPSTVPVTHMSTQEYIVEGANYTDITCVFSADLHRPPILSTVPRLHVPQIPTSSAMPPLATSAGVTSSIPVSALHILAQSQTAPKASTPPTNILSTNSSTSFVIKQERNIPLSSTKTPPPPLSVVSNTSVPSNQQLNKPPTTVLSTQPISIKQYIKSIPTINTTTTTVSHNPSNLTSAITYVGPNTPGVVVPMVSSSGTTTAPLSIASSRLQSLNRHLVQARRSTATSGSDTVPPLAFKVSLAPTSTVSIQTNAGGSTTTATTTATVTSQVRNPPPIKTVSNGSAMYSVLYTGIGNKITIKRKTDGDDDIHNKKNISKSSSTSTSPITAPTTATSSAVFRQLTITKPNNQNKRRGCRCGNATVTPGKLTCCGQRCPCYVDSKSCIGCKCRGCRNPHRPDGGKVRPVIPELACYEIQMADESSSLSPQESPLTTTTNVNTTLPILKNTTISQQPQQTLTQFEEYKPIPQTTQLNLVSHINTTSSNSSTTTMTPTATLIPFRTLQTTSQQQHQLQRINTINGSGNTTQLTPTALSTSNVNSATNTSSNMLQLENLQRESVLIQNADGNYQVVNLFTAGGSNATQLAPLQRIHAISNASSVTTAATSSPSGLQQIIVQQTQQTHQRHNLLPQRIVTSSIVNTTSASPPVTATTTTTQLQQLQQQLKQNNLIAVHPLTTNRHLHQQQQNHQQQQQQQLHHHTLNMTTATPLISPSTGSNTATITLSPIIVTSPNTLTTDMFSSSEGSTDDFITINNVAPSTLRTTTTPSNITNGNSTAHLLAMPQTSDVQQQFSTITLDNVNGGGNLITTSSATTTGNFVPTTAHLTPALVEVIDSNEL